MSRHYGVRTRFGPVTDRYYIPVVVLTICVVIIGLSYLFG